MGNSSIGRRVWVWGLHRDPPHSCLYSLIQLTDTDHMHLLHFNPGLYMKETDIDRTVLFSYSWELGKDSEERNVIDMEGLSCRVKRETNFF